MIIRRCFKWGSRWCKNLCNGSSFHTCRGPIDSTFGVKGVWREGGNGVRVGESERREARGREGKEGMERERKKATEREV